MDEILGVLFAVVIGMMFLPQVTNAIATSRHAMTDVTTAQEQQQWATAVSNYVSQNMATLVSTATAGTPVTLSVATVQAANVGLPTNFSGTNPFNQTWTAQVLQPTYGTLQVLAFGSGGNAVKDQELGQIARAAAGSGGFIPTNSSGAYAGGPANAFGTYGAWKISTAGYSVGQGGAPATLLTFSNGTLSSNYLYRNAIPGQPQLNEMNTDLGMNSNNITSVGQLQTNAGNGVQVGSSYYYGDNANSAIRQSGALYVQNQAGTAAAPINSGTVSASGDVDVTGNVNANGSVRAGGAVVNGNVTVNNGSIAVNNGTITANASNWAVQGQSNNWSYVATDGSGSLNAAETSTAGSMSVNDVQLRSTGQWVSQIPQAPTSFTQIGWYTGGGESTLGWWKWCGIVGVNGPDNNSGVLPVTSNGQGAFNWIVNANGTGSSAILVGCMN